MNVEQIFESYLEYRLGRANALTPGQKLEVVQQLEQEARQEGKIPSGENSIAQVPLDSPVVQAVLRGEPISIGNTVVKRKSGLADWPTSRKLAVLGGGFVLFVALMITVMLLALNSGKADATPTTPTLEPSKTPLPTATDLPTPSETPTETPTEAPTQGPLIPDTGAPAADVNAPASIELKGRLFVLQQGAVDDKTGLWNPRGAEWLNGTEVRRVIALPMTQVTDLALQPGDDVTIRTRNGRVVVYPVTRLLDLNMDQIEVFTSLSPSILITLFDPAQGNNPSHTARQAIIGELTPLLALTATPAVQRASVTVALNLRATASLTGAVIAGMPQGTLVTVSSPPELETVAGRIWIFVHSPFGNGWVVRSFLSFQ